MVDWLAKGTGNPYEIGARMNEACAEEQTIKAALAEAPSPPVIALHPGTLAHYEALLERLQQAISKGVAAGKVDYVDAVRDLVETVTVRRDDSRKSGIEVTIAGRLNALLGEKAFPNGVRAV